MSMRHTIKQMTFVAITANVTRRCQSRSMQFSQWNVSVYFYSLYNIVFIFSIDFTLLLLQSHSVHCLTFEQTLGQRILIILCDIASFTTCSVQTCVTLQKSAKYYIAHTMNKFYRLQDPKHKQKQQHRFKPVIDPPIIAKSVANSFENPSVCFI